jgi:hypothetical protein
LHRYTGVAVAAASLEPAMSQQSSSGVASPPQQKMPLPTRSRAQSISSDRPSTIAYSFMSPPLSVSPEAAFIATSAASQIVTNDHDSHADAWYDQHGVEPSGETAVVSPAALQLVNNFLDQLMFNFLSIARSTNLSALRPAVSEVLKPKLAKDAINQADEELREYLGGEDEEAEQSATPTSARDWDLELAWKRTRLRCMVYSSLGDMEEEDEDFYMEQEHLDAGLGDRQSEIVSPAVAIFLTSILEFMGEQALIVAGQAAYHRMRLKYEKELKDGSRSPSDPADRIIVEELDMERVALDRTLGRLWRAWKKKIRSPGITTMDQRLSRSYSRDSMRAGSGHLRSPSSITGEPSVPTVPEPLNEGEGNAIEEQEWELVDEPASFEEYLVAASIPLPLGERDVDEIEVPGLAYHSDDETEAYESDEDIQPPRPKSLAVFSLGGYELPTVALAPASTFRKRSNSVPNIAVAPFLPRTQLEETDDEEVEDDVGDVVEIIDQQRLAGQVADGKSPKSPKGGWSESEEEESPIQSATMPASLQAVLAQVQEDDDEALDEDDDIVIEEPQILMSSRISISGRSSSPATSERGKPAAINTNLPARTPSIHSARLVDVAGPRSPAIGSRRSSAEVELIRQVNPVRVSGIRTQTPPVVEEKMRRSPDSMSAFRSGKVGVSENSISEAEEISGIAHDDTASPVSPSAIGLAVIPEPVEKQPVVPGNRSSFGPVPHRTPATPAPPSPVKTTVTKVTIISSTASNGSFQPADKTEPPRRPTVQTRPQPTTPTNPSFSPSEPPAVPDRNSVRKQSGGSPRGSPQQVSTIGQVSVERKRTRSPSEPTHQRVHDSPSQATRQQHTSGSTSSTSTNRLKPVRTSEETTRSRIDVARDFEELIQSDQTIQYTLTPENMRDIDVSLILHPISRPALTQIL